MNTVSSLPPSLPLLFKKEVKKTEISLFLTMLFIFESAFQVKDIFFNTVTPGIQYEKHHSLHLVKNIWKVESVPGIIKLENALEEILSILVRDHVLAEM